MSQDTITAIEAAENAKGSPTSLRIWVDTSNTVSFTTDFATGDDAAASLRDIGEAARDGEFIADGLFVVRARDIKCAALVFESNDF